MSGLSGLPGTVAPLAPVALTTAHPAQAQPLFTALANQFDIKNPGAANINAAVKVESQPPRSLEKSVKKYLPETYRNSFNFVAPRTPNAVTDDAYHCAVREAEPKKGFTQQDDKVSWGAGVRNAMRQPLLATALGMIYHTHITVNATEFRQGRLALCRPRGRERLQTQQTADPNFVRLYAARIPVLEAGKPRSVFGAILFPVMAVRPRRAITTTSSSSKPPTTTTDLPRLSMRSSR